MLRCQRAGCDGVIEFGYCSRCGLAPAHAHQTPQPAPTNGAQPGSHAQGKHQTAARGPDAASTPAPSPKETPSTRSTAGSTRLALSGGYATLPPLPPQDPLATLISNEVPERKRVCSNCGAK